MSPRLDHVEAAREEANRLGATFELKKGGKHLIGIVHYNGKCRKTSLSVSPSRLACFQTVKYIRKMVKEMEGLLRTEKNWQIKKLGNDVLGKVRWAFGFLQTRLKKLSFIIQMEFIE